MPVTKKIFNLDEWNKFVEELAEENKAENIFEEGAYSQTGLVSYFELDSWPYDEAILLMAGIQPRGAIVKYHYENFMGQDIHGAKIYGAELLCTTHDIYSIPTVNSLDEDIRAWEHELEKLDRTGFTMSKDEVKNKEKQINAEISLSTELLKDDHILKFDRIFREYEHKLSRIHRIWTSGYHNSRNPIKYYLDWAKEKNIEIEWLDWAIENNYYTDESIKSEHIDKSLDPREKTTWSRIVKALCLELKIPLENPYTAATEIQRIAARHKLHIATKDETIAKRIKEITDD